MGRAGKILVFILAFGAVSVLTRTALDSYGKRRAVAKAEQALDQLKKDAASNHPNATASEAMQREASAQMSSNLAAQTSDRKRLETAAGNFMGFYLVNVRERDEYCRERGVDIGPFVAAFQRGHTNELGKARDALAGTPFGEDELYKRLKPQLTSVIAQDMQDIAAQNKISVKQACELVAENGASLAAEMHLSKAQPAVHRALIGAR